MLALLGQADRRPRARIKEVEVKLGAAHKASAISQLLATIPGVGLIIALTLAAEIDPSTSNPAVISPPG